MSDYDVEQTKNHIRISLKELYRYLCSAPLGGGMGFANNFINIYVDSTSCTKNKNLLEPDVFIMRYCKKIGIEKNVVGMMTAARMETFSLIREQRDDIWVDAGVTVGLTNACRAGEDASWPYFEATLYTLGTINIILLTNASLSEMAMVEAVALVAEAKASVLTDLNVKSRSSDVVATGTGTDAVAVYSSITGKEIRYCGKHVLIGEMIAKAVIRALSQSLKKYTEVTGFAV